MRLKKKQLVRSVLVCLGACAVSDAWVNVGLCLYVHAFILNTGHHAPTHSHTFPPRRKFRVANPPIRFIFWEIGGTWRKHRHGENVKLYTDSNTSSVIL